MALKPLKPPKAPKFPSYQLGKKPIYTTGVKKPNLVQPRSVQPYAGPARANDYGQNFLYPGGYTLPKNPVDMSTFFTGGGGSQYKYGADPSTAAVGQTNAQPDYGSLISGDWEVQDAEAAMAAQMARLRGDFQAQLRSQLIDLGVTDTSKLGSLGKYIDAETIQKAAANKYSATAQNAQGAERLRSQNNAALAARGLLSSGETTNQQQRATAQHESANYAALRGFLEGGAAGLSGIADQEYQLARGVAAARAAAAQRAAEIAQLGAMGDNPNRITPNESGFYDFRNAMGITRQAGPTVQGVSSSPLAQRAWMAKNPRGNYYNYLRAWHRQHPGTGWGY